MESIYYFRYCEDEITEKYESTLSSLHLKHVAELNKVLGELSRERSQFQEEIDHLTVLLGDTKEEFRLRPSRDEDIAFIKQLQEKVNQQEMLCQQLNDEKKYYKLELVNREENFNKIFNNSPNVGFMNTTVGITRVRFILLFFSFLFQKILNNLTN